MNCVANRLPTTGGPGFFPQAAFELHQQAQPTTSQAYLYSIHPPAANDQTDSDEELRRAAPLGQQWRRASNERSLNDRSQKNDELKAQLSHEHCDESKPVELLTSSFKCPASKPESVQTAKLNSCDLGLSKCDDGEKRRCDSLESVASRNSSSGTNEPESQSSRGAAASSQIAASATARKAGLAPSRSVLVSTRFVSPPKIDDDQLISVIDWQTIPLDDDKHKPRAHADHALQPKPDPREDALSRLNSLITRCKVPTSQNSHGGGRKQLAGTKEDATGKGSREASRDDQLAEEKVRGQRHLSMSNGSAGGRKRSFGRDRVGSSTSFKSTRSVDSAKLQIGKIREPFMFAGILSSMVGSVFFSCGMLCIKFLPDSHGLAEKTKQIFFRSCILTLLCGATIVYQKSTFKIRRDEIWLNALRSVLGFLGIFGTYVALKYISLGDCTALIFSSPIWTSLLSHFILNEPLQWIQLLALPASLVGIIFIAHPALLINMDQHAGASERQPLLDVVDVLDVTDLLPLNNSTANMVAQLNQTLNRDIDISMSTDESYDLEHRWKGILISLITSLIVSLVYIVLKFRKSTSIQTTTFWLGVTCCGLSLFVMCFSGFGEMPSGFRDWALLLCNGFCSWVGQVLLQWGLKYEDASVLSVIRTLDVAMNFTLSALFLDEQIMWTSVLGASIIAFVVVVIMLNSWISKKLCPATPEVDPSERRHSSCDDDELSTSEAHFSSASRKADRYQDEAPLEGEITLKLEAPSIRKLRQGELAA